MISLLFFLIIVELSIGLIVNRYKKIKWLITDIDAIKLIDKRKFNKFKKENYNFELGWDKKRNTKNIDLIDNNKILYSIDKKGFRKSRYNKKKNTISTFGDSYTFCRQVKDSQTWQELLSKDYNQFISNYGVGNYGLDQAYLKFKKINSNKTEKIVIFCFVPETICRIQSSWKNYLEFGNLHAFKPYCILKNNKLVIKRNPLKPINVFKDLKNIINQIKINDRFYKEKYLKHYLKAPFVLSFFKNINFNLNIFFQILNYKKIKNIDVMNYKLFPIVMKHNILNSHNLYNETKSKKILELLINKIDKDVLKKKKKCIFLIIPQLFDLKLLSNSNYQSYFKNLNKKFNIIDTTENFKKLNNFEKMYIDDKYGGHLNKNGNKFVSKIVKEFLNKYEKNL